MNLSEKLKMFATQYCVTSGSNLDKNYLAIPLVIIAIMAVFLLLLKSYVVACVGMVIFAFVLICGIVLKKRVGIQILNMISFIFLIVLYMPLFFTFVGLSQFKDGTYKTSILIAYIASMAVGAVLMIICTCRKIRNIEKGRQKQKSSAHNFDMVWRIGGAVLCVVLIVLLRKATPDLRILIINLLMDLFAILFSGIAGSSVLQFALCVRYKIKPEFENRQRNAGAE